MGNDYYKNAKEDQIFTKTTGIRQGKAMTNKVDSVPATKIRLSDVEEQLHASKNRSKINGLHLIFHKENNSFIDLRTD